MKYTDPDGQVMCHFKDALGYGHHAIQRLFGYHDSYDAVSYMIPGFVIDGTKFDLGNGMQLRLWKGHYGVGGTGGEMGLYTNNGWSSATRGDMASLGIVETTIDVYRNDGQRITGYDEDRKDKQGNPLTSFWTNAFSAFKNHFISRKNLTTVNTITFDTEEHAESFMDKLESAKRDENSYFFKHGSDTQWKLSEDNKTVIIKFGNSKNVPD